MKKQWRLIASAACLAAVSALVLGGVPSTPKCVGAYDMRPVPIEFCWGVDCSGLPGNPYLYKAKCLTWCCPDSWGSGRKVDHTVCEYLPTWDCCPVEGPAPAEGCARSTP